MKVSIWIDDTPFFPQYFLGSINFLSLGLVVLGNEHVDLLFFVSPTFCVPYPQHTLASDTRKTYSQFREGKGVEANERCIRESE